MIPSRVSAMADRTCFPTRCARCGILSHPYITDYKVQAGAKAIGVRYDGAL